MVVQGAMAFHSGARAGYTSERLDKTSGRQAIMKAISILFLLGIFLSTGRTDAAELPRQAELFDPARQRRIPLAIQPPQGDCRPHACRVAFLSPGYGLGPDDYRFLSDYLSRAGYLVVSIQGVLPEDPRPADTGNVVSDRMPMWTNGAENLAFVKSRLMSKYRDYDWSKLLLVGHSNGGDLSALALVRTPGLATSLITLDNRRYPIPRDKAVRVLSIRGSDFPADPGVLPAEEEAAALGQCIVRIPDARHDDMTDHGPGWLRDRITRIIGNFIDGNDCNGR